MGKNILIIVSALLFSITFMTGCDKQNPDLKGFDSIIGCWANPVYESNMYPNAVYCYERVPTLPANSPSIKFLKNGTLIERKGAGWCATPPITYGDFSGTWQLRNDNDIKINVAFWGGMEQKIWKIVDVTNTSLRIEVIVEDIQYN